MGPIIESINSAGCGQTIRVAMYSIGNTRPGPDFANALIAAHQRGVIVKALMDSHSDNAIWQSMVTELGNDPQASSFAALCPGGCLTHYSGSALHAKYYMLSGGSDASRTVTVSSANPTPPRPGPRGTAASPSRQRRPVQLLRRYFTAMSREHSTVRPLVPDYHTPPAARTPGRRCPAPSYQWPARRAAGATPGV